MNGKIAKRLRKIARGLELAPKTTYGVVGPKNYTMVEDEKFFLPQTVVMEECQRKAYKTAKRLYLRG